MNNDSGFTLIEILVAFFLMMTLSGLGMMGYSQIQQRTRVTSGADEIRSLLRQAREKSLAQIDGGTYRVTGTGGVVVLERVGGSELERYQLSSTTTIVPSSWSWEFVPVTGAVSGCVGQCQLSVTDGSVTASIEVSSFGLVR